MSNTASILSIAHCQPLPDEVEIFVAALVTWTDGRVRAEILVEIGDWQPLPNDYVLTPTTKARKEVAPTDFPLLSLPASVDEERRMRNFTPHLKSSAGEHTVEILTSGSRGMYIRVWKKLEEAPICELIVWTEPDNQQDFFGMETMQYPWRIRTTISNR